MNIIKSAYRAIRSNRIVNSFLPDRNEINRMIQRNLSVAFMHQKIFPEYKGVNTGKKVILFASGPSLKSFKPISDCIKVGVNQTIMVIDDLDYLFVEDVGGSNDALRENFISYKGNNCQKFFGYSESWMHSKIHGVLMPESDVIAAGANRFVVDSLDTPMFKHEFVYDIASQPLGGFGSIVFPAMQFILWTNPDVIYLVGCDCSAGGHFFSGDDNKDDTSMYDSMIRPWKQLKIFASKLYPKTRILSINPVGLKGVFEDLYQQ